MTSGKRKIQLDNPVTRRGILVGGLMMLAGCNVALVEAPNYSVTEVESFKTAGAPSHVMMLEVVDASNTLPVETWTRLMSNHGFAPRLRFVSDPGNIEHGETIKPENRLVAVVSPTRTTMGSTLCNAPQSSPTDATADRVIVRFGFCAGDDIISETRARFIQENFEKQLATNADVISFQIFPRHLRNNDDDRDCNPFMPGC